LARPSFAAPAKHASIKPMARRGGVFTLSLHFTYLV